ncbi:MAG: hypothetical protein WDA75_06460, partial [Candidatus Latescibacterota bacterium]
IGEIGGADEEEAAAYIRRYFDRPVVGFVAGQTAPSGRRMGHAGAIISGGKGTAADKMRVLRAAGIWVCDSPAEIGAAVAELLGLPSGRNEVTRDLSSPAHGEQDLGRAAAASPPAGG